MTRASHAQRGKDRFAVVLVTAPSLDVARRLARAALKGRLAACVNLVPGVESHYWWQGKLDRAREVLLLLKTTHARLEPLEKLIIAQHPYDTPEFVVLDIRSGNRKYLNWVNTSVQNGSPVATKL